jgi:hypothetical protein
MVLREIQAADDTGGPPLKTTAPAMPREGPLAASDISWTISVNVASGASE